MDLTQVADGEYVGSFDAVLVAAKVKVTVKDHKIKAIQLLEHRNERGKREEVVIQRVLQQQALDVDTVSGATSSSKTILKAIENALRP